MSVLVLATIILAVRRTDAFVNPQFWAEDGVIFFLQQYENGWTAVVKPYAGYLHLIPRLVALFADSFFSYSSAPAVYNFSSLAITVFVVANVFSPRLPIGHNALFAVSIVLIPHLTNEVFMNITNIQWITSILLVVTLAKECPDRKYGNIKGQLAYDMAIIVLCGLTGPFIVFLLPLFISKWSRNINSYNNAIMAFACIISFVQLSLILSEIEILGAKGSHLVLDFNIYSSLVGHKIFGNLFLGKNTAYVINPHLLAIMYFGLILILFRYSPQKKFTNIFLYTHLIVLLATLFEYRDRPQILIPAGSGVRYFFIPNIMIAWSLITFLDQKEKWKRLLTTTTLAFILVSSLSSGFHSKFVDFKWGEYSRSIGKEDVRIPINPRGWYVFVKARK